MFLSRQKRVSCFLWIHLAGYGAKSPPAELAPTGQKSKSVQKPTGQKSKSVQKPTDYFVPFTSLMSPFVLTTPGHLPLIISSQTSTGVRLSVVLNTTQNGSDASLCRIQHHARWQSLSHRHSTVQQCFLFTSISSSLKTAVFASLSHIEHHTRW